MGYSECKVIADMGKTRPGQEISKVYIKSLEKSEIKNQNFKARVKHHLRKPSIFHKLDLNIYCQKVKQPLMRMHFINRFHTHLRAQNN